LNSTSFYRRAAALPLILPVFAVGVLLTYPSGRHPHPLTGLGLDIAGFVAFAGAWGVLPYVVYLAAVFGIRRPRSEGALRRAVWLAPFAIGIPFGLAFGVIGLVQRGAGSAASALAFWGTSAIVAGLFYAILIEGSFHLAKSRGWIT
jgi:hypothetical protein